MDGVVDPKFAVAMGKLGGIAILNLEGVQTKYEDPTKLLTRLLKVAAKKLRVWFSAYMKNR